MMTYSELYEHVAKVSSTLRKIGIRPGDRVVGYMPNIVETVMAMLGATSVGAVWSSCGSELGADAALDRLGQIEPRILFTIDGYQYKGKTFDHLQKVKKLVEGIPTLEKVVIFPYLNESPDISSVPKAILYEDFVQDEEGVKTIEFVQVPFEHPLFIMFSSGTTGKPKCMVQSVGGVLINHLKELILHTDLKRSDVITYITSPSWMMWNWLVTSLAVGATLVLYDGNPLYPDWKTMWNLIDEENITIFGCSASYIYYLKSVDAAPREVFKLDSLREISQTGSALSPEGFEYVYKKIKEDLHFNSISGGTDINGCFFAGSPTLPVHAGELQSPALAMKVKAYDENGHPVLDQQGELVCELPSPSMPLYFWNDPSNEKYENAYFNFYRHKRVWRHGDYIVIHSKTRGATFFGRSDAVLKPSGVRIGTAEIYNIVEEMNEIVDSLAIGQMWKGDQRIILFVQLAPGYQLTEELKNRIKQELRERASPRHVPAIIMEAPAIPYTFSGKKVELAVTNIINGRPVTNRGALRNPESLDYFEKIKTVLEKE